MVAYRGEMAPWVWGFSGADDARGDRACLVIMQRRVQGALSPSCMVVVAILWGESAEKKVATLKRLMTLRMPGAVRRLCEQAAQSQAGFRDPEDALAKLRAWGCE